MKTNKLFFIPVFFFFLFIYKNSIFAQDPFDIYGSDIERIFRLKSDGTNYSELKLFENYKLGRLSGGITEGSDSNFYGLTQLSIFKNIRHTNEMSPISIFEENDSIIGYNPTSSLLKGENTTFYGVTSKGGEFDSGSLFSIQEDGSNMTKLYSLNEPNREIHKLSLGNTNNIYANTTDKILEFALDGSNYETLYEINNAGYITDFLQSPDGHLYFVIAGPLEFRKLMKINPTTNTITELFSFNDNIGSPTKFILASDGRFYISCVKAIIRLDQDGSNLFIIKDLEFISGIMENMIEGPNSKIYGLWKQIPNALVYQISMTDENFSFINNLPWVSNSNFAFPIINSSGSLYFSYAHWSGITGLNKGISIKVFQFDPTNNNVHTFYPSCCWEEGCFLNNLALNHQTIIGNTDMGNVVDEGSLFRMNFDGSGFEIIYEHDNQPNHPKFHHIIAGRDGKFYASSFENIYSIDSDGTVTLLYEDVLSFERTKLYDGYNNNLFAIVGNRVHKFTKDGTNQEAINHAMPNLGVDIFPVLTSVLHSFNGSLYVAYSFHTGSGSGSGQTYNERTFSINADGSDYQEVTSWIRHSLSEDNNDFIYASTPNRIYRLKHGDTQATLIKETILVNYIDPKLLHGSDGYLYFSTRYDVQNGTTNILKILPDGTNENTLLTFPNTQRIAFLFDKPILTSVNQLEPSNKNYFSVFPNPTKHQLNIYFSADHYSKNEQFRLVNLAGEIVESLDIPANETTYMLSVDNMPSGIYFLHYLKDGINVKTEQVIIQK